MAEGRHVKSDHSKIARNQPFKENLQAGNRRLPAVHYQYRGTFPSSIDPSLSTATATTATTPTSTGAPTGRSCMRRVMASTAMSRERNAGS